MAKKLSEEMARDERASQSDVGRQGALTEREERALMRFHDGACGFFEKRRVKKLLDENRVAARFLEEMQVVGECARIGEEFARGDINLWDRIASRIREEERAAIFLG